MTNVSDNEHPRWRMFGRKVRPLSFWTGYVSLILTVGLLLDMITGTTLNGIVGIVLLPVAVAVFLLLFLGFWLNSSRAMTHGLLISAGMWSAVAVIVLAETWSTSISGWIAVAWAGVTAWAWWIEVDVERERERASG